MEDDLKKIARKYKELLGRAASGTFHMHIEPKDLYWSLQVIAERLLALETSMDDRIRQALDANVRSNLSKLVVKVEGDV